MMKGFMSVSKMLGLLVLATGLIVSGCAAPSDEADKVGDMVDHGSFTIPVTFDSAAKSLSFGNGGNSGTGTFDGHVVEVTTSGCSGVTTVACTLNVINRDPSMYMVDTTILLSYCTDCATNGANFTNADCIGSPCVYPGGNWVDADGSTGRNTPTGINQNGYCIVENGNYTKPQPYTVKGCASFDTVTADKKPAQHISPVCGSQSVDWDFSDDDGTRFTFYANIAATWYPVNPTADTRINANDWANRTTMMIMLVDVDEPGTDVGSAQMGPNWNVGTYKHSTPLAGGYGNPSHITLPPGRYFALNLAAELPDRIEAQAPGYYTAFTRYEYHVQYASIVRFNPNVVTPVLVEGLISATSPTYLMAGGVPVCAQCAHQANANTARRMFDSVTGLDDHGPDNSVIGFADKGFVYSFVNMRTDPFAWNQAAGSGNPWRYYTAGGARMCVRLANLVPLHAGHVGNTRFAVGTAGTCNTGNGTGPLVTTEAAALVDEGIDPQPDMPIGIYYFKVAPVAGGSSVVGSGTMFWPEQHSGYSGFTVNHTGVDRDGGASTTDWVAPCIPMDPLYQDDPVNQGCTPGKILAIPDTDWVFKGAEQSNPKIEQSGFSTPGGGAFQAWSASMCVGL